MLNQITRDKIQAQFRMPFVIDHVWGGNGTPFIRFGYWYRVDLDTLQSIVGDEYTVEENDDWGDEDTLTRWMYKLIENK